MGCKTNLIFKASMYKLLLTFLTLFCCLGANAQTYDSSNVYFYCKNGQYGVGKQVWFFIIDGDKVYDSTVTTNSLMSRNEAIDKVNKAIRNCRYGEDGYSYNPSLSTSKYKVYSKVEKGGIGRYAGTFNIAVALDKSHILRWRKGYENERNTYQIFDPEEIIPKPIDNSFLE